MAWRNFFERERRGGDVSFPVTVPVNDGPVQVTISSHALDTASGTIECWSYVTRGLQEFGQKELMLTLKREAGESAADYPDHPLQFVSSIVPLAAAGRLVDAGDTTRFGAAGNALGGHFMYIGAQPLPGVDVPRGALAAILISNDELDTLQQCGPARVMSRLGREASHYPCPPWSDRSRVMRAQPRRTETILNRVPRMRARGTTALYERRQNVRIDVSAGGRTLLKQGLESWSPDTPLALLTDVGPLADGCLVWDPDVTALNAIGPANAKGELLAGCFLLIVAGQAHTEFRLIEDGLGLILTREDGNALRDALINGTDLRIPTPTGAITVAADPGSGLPLDIVLLYPETEFIARGITAASLSLYVGDLARVIEKAATAHGVPDAFQLVVAVRPEGRSRVWDIAEPLRTQLEAIQPPSPQGGPIAFMIRTRAEPFAPPGLPAEWAAAADALTAELQKRGVSVDEVLDRIWPA